MRRLSISILLALCLTARADLLPEGFPYRRPLTLKLTPTDAPGDSIATAEFHTNGSQRPDAADLRITSADRTLLPFRILQSSPEDDFVRIAFAAKSDGTYYAWWGNPKADRPADKPLDIRRGLLLEAFPPQGRPQLSTQRMLDSGPPVPAVAACFIPDPSIGFNPFNDERNLLLRTSGQFKIDKPTPASLAFTVSDSGALLIDGKEVARETRAGIRARVRNPVAITFTPGWHTLEIRQANHNNANVAAALAWMKDGEKNYAPFPGNLFAPISRATPGLLEKPGAPNQADFTIEPAGETFTPPSYYLQRYTFEAQLPAATRPTITWDFGDGQTATGAKKVSHLYLAPGVYPITLKLDFAGTSLATTIRLAVGERMVARFPRPPEDNPKTAATLLRDYDPTKLRPEALLRGTLFFSDTENPAALLAWGTAWLTSNPPRNALPDPTLLELTHSIAGSALSKGLPKPAADLYKRAADLASAPETRAKCFRLYLQTLAEQANDPGAALAAAQENLKSGKDLRYAPSHLLYAALATGDPAASKSANPPRPGGDLPTKSFQQQQIHEGVLARNVENAIRTKDYEEAANLLLQWELDSPTALYDGFTRTLRVKLLASQNQFLLAARVAIAHAKANPTSFYAAELLSRAADNFQNANDPAAAKAARDLLLSRYPESPYARNPNP